MKKFLTVTTMVLALWVIGSAQKAADTPNFAGTWELDFSKSRLPESRGPKVTGQTLTVTQDAKQITLSAETKTDGAMAVPVQSHTYNLDGTETDTEMRMMQRTAPGKAKAKPLSGGKLELGLTATIDTQMGSMAITQSDVLELADGGKTLKIHRSRTMPRGTEEGEWVYTKK